MSAREAVRAREARKRAAFYPEPEPERPARRSKAEKADEQPAEEAE
jgi:hypothetical protein